MPPKKKIAALVKVQLQAGAATPAPPGGTALGPHGVNIMDFCKAYNPQTESMRGNGIPVEITIYEDRSFTFITKTPPAAELIKKAAGLQKGSGVPHKEKVGRLTKDQVREIATTKMPDLNANDVEAAMKIVEGTARSMGVTTESPRRPRSGLSRPRRPTTPRGRAALARRPHLERKTSHAAQQDLPRSGGDVRPGRALLPADRDQDRQGRQQEEVRRDRRRRHAPRRGPAQGRPDGARHRQPAPRHRQDRSGARVRERREGRRSP